MDYTLAEYKAEEVTDIDLDRIVIIILFFLV